MSDTKEVKFRCDVQLLDRLDDAASRQRSSRSALLKELIARHVELEKPARAKPRFGDDDDRVRVCVRLNRRELSALECEAKALGIHRSDMMRKLLHSQLYDGREFVILSPETKRGMTRLEGQLRRLAGMVNRSEMKINAALNDHALHELKDHAEDLAAMRENVLAAFDEVAKFVTAVCAEEHKFWRGNLDEARPRAPYRQAARAQNRR